MLREGLDDDAHEVGLRGGDDADGLGVGERRRVLEGEDGGEGREVLEGLLRFEEVLAWGLLLVLVARVSVVPGGGGGGGDWEAPEAAAEEGGEGWERGGGSHHRAVVVAEDGERCDRHQVS